MCERNSWCVHASSSFSARLGSAPASRRERTRRAGWTISWMSCVATWGGWASRDVFLGVSCFGSGSSDLCRLGCHRRHVIGEGGFRIRVCELCSRSRLAFDRRRVSHCVLELLRIYDDEMRWGLPLSGRLRHYRFSRKWMEEILEEIEERSVGINPQLKK